MSCDGLVRKIEEAFGAAATDAPGIEDEIEPWSDLDARAFRANLPGAMIRVLRGGGGQGLRWWLTLPLSGDEDVYLQKWSALDARQKDCVRRFLLWMIDQDEEYSGSWEEAYESYWESVPAA